MNCIDKKKINAIIFVITDIIRNAMPEKYKYDKNIR